MFFAAGIICSWSLPEGVPHLMTSDADSLYVLVQPPGGGAMKLYAIPKEGGEPSLLASRIVAAKALKADGAFVYFDSDRGRERVTKDGWERELLR